MISSDHSEFTATQEYNTPENSANPYIASTSWSRLKDPRIVRVSRAFGGKDRHSKVCTVRGLRDRRVRLSVPTAIQLYDLQDRLGLNQPSKVVDWLLNAARNEIDELPPLQIPQGSFMTPNLLQTPMRSDLFDNSNMQDNNQEDSFVSSSTNNFRWDPVITSQNRHGDDHLNRMNFSLGARGSHHQSLVYQHGGGGGTSSTTQSYLPSRIENNTNDSEMHFQDGSVLQLSNSSLTSTRERIGFWLTR